MNRSPTWIRCSSDSSRWSSRTSSQTSTLTTLYVTHDQDEAAVVADTIGVMRDGSIVAEGSPETTLALAPDEWVASFLGVEQPIEGRVTAEEDGILTVDCGGTSIYAHGRADIGQSVILGVRPEDVVLLEPDIQIPLTSARNRLDARVVSTSRVGALTRVVLESGTIEVLGADLARIGGRDASLRWLWGDRALQGDRCPSARGLGRNAS